MSARQARLQRGPVLALAVAVVAGVGVTSVLVGTPVASSTTSPQMTSVPPADAQSSSWYCLGGDGRPGAGHMRLSLANTGTSPVEGAITVTSSGGAQNARATSLGPRRAATIEASSIEHGSWLAARVDLSGGGVAASELVEGLGGWSQAPCVRAASPTWYFAAGSTAGGASLTTLLYNPTSTPAVADVSYVTASGVVQPEPYQGVVVPPGRLVADEAVPFVIAQQQVATIVTTKSGQLVAAEVQRSKGQTRGLSVQSGAAAPANLWTVPVTSNTPGGTVVLHILNPTASTARVTVAVRLPSGPVAPLSGSVPPSSAWQLALSTQTRIPPSVDYSTQVSAVGAGVVVARTVEAPVSAAGPGVGALGALAMPAATSRRWVLPASDVASAGGRARAQAIAILNPGSHPISVTVATLSHAKGFVPLPSAAALPLGPGGLVVFTPSAGSGQTFAVDSTGPSLVTEDLAPAGAPGVLTTAGLQAGP